MLRHDPVTDIHSMTRSLLDAVPEPSPFAIHAPIRVSTQPRT
nr:hypothetical protein JVH1_6599 [Rhodococcus sp. JVH1]